ncbi:hypothetical protein [Longispora albida]|uniref:hypothetical protein n=1 Tax=Longispora albida TaxID=203523 RepID=UPI0012F93498|nr:hypothetical protein [Longispora albida]
MASTKRYLALAAAAGATSAALLAPAAPAAAAPSCFSYYELTSSTEAVDAEGWAVCYDGTEKPITVNLFRRSPSGVWQQIATGYGYARHACEGTALTSYRVGLKTIQANCG